MKIRLFFTLILIFITNFANASVYEHPASVSGFIDELPKLESVSKSFKQEKIIKNTLKPLYSGGNFRFIKGKGVTFETLYPVKTTVTYSNKDYKQINDIILAISNKKYSKIEKEFSFFYEKKNGQWTLGLKPKQSSQINDYISTLTIWGNKDIDKIVILLKNGNKTTIWFSTK